MIWMLLSVLGAVLVAVLFPMFALAGLLLELHEQHQVRLDGRMLAERARQAVRLAVLEGRLAPVPAPRTSAVLLQPVAAGSVRAS